MSVFPRKSSKTQSSLNFLQSGPRRFTKSDFSGLAPIRRVLIKLLDPLLGRTHLPGAFKTRRLPEGDGQKRTPVVTAMITFRDFSGLDWTGLDTRIGTF